METIIAMVAGVSLAFVAGMALMAVVDKWLHDWKDIK